jgi:hypothetical protein
MWEFDFWKVSQAVRRTEKMLLILAKMPASGGLLRFRGSPGSQFSRNARPIRRKSPATNAIGERPLPGQCGHLPKDYFSNEPTRGRSARFDQGPLSRTCRAPRNETKELRCTERLIDVGDNVVRMLDANRKTHISVADTGLQLLFW